MSFQRAACVAAGSALSAAAVAAVWTSNPLTGERGHAAALYRHRVHGAPAPPRVAPRPEVLATAERAGAVTLGAISAINMALGVAELAAGVPALRRAWQPAAHMAGAATFGIIARALWVDADRTDARGELRCGAAGADHDAYRAKLDGLRSASILK